MESLKPPLSSPIPIRKGGLFIYLFKINLFIYFWLRWVFVAACRLFSSCSEQGLLFVAVRGLLIVVGGFSCCRARALGMRAQ